MKILLVVATVSEIQQEKFSSNDLLITGVGMLNTAIAITKKLSRKLLLSKWNWSGDGNNSIYPNSSNLYDIPWIY